MIGPRTFATFPRIEDYALVGDCRCTALISRAGAVEWLCFPDFHSPSLFCSVLDRRRGGHFAISGRNTTRSSRRYRDDTNILETLFECDGGTAKVIDFMPVVLGDRSLQPERELVRIVEAVEGAPVVETEFAPRPDYGQHDSLLQRRGQFGWSLSHGGNLHLLRTDAELSAESEGRLRGTERIPAGERRRFSLSFTQRDTAVIPSLGREVDGKLAATEDWWRSWSRQNTYAGAHKQAVMRSILTLKLLQSCLTGAVIAAPTTSLPEAIGGERNWDYRYCWLRDTAFTLLSFTDTGFFFEASAFFDWMMHATWMTQPRLQPVYDIYGRTRFKERKIEQLNGYAGSSPVRIGNAASDQLQIDIYGSVVAAARAFIDRGKTLDPMERRLLAKIGDAVCEQWREPDNGIWEFRSGRRHNTWSKVMCWSALRDLLHLDACKAISVQREKLKSEAEKIQASIFENACDQRDGHFVGAFGENFVDATLLLLPRVGFIEPDDPRMQATRRQINKRLRSGVFIRRYDADDNIASNEGAFMVCGFWAIDDLVRCGRLEEAEESLDALVRCANDVGLLSEEIRPHDQAMLGNFPQAFSHSGLVNAALALAASKEKRSQS